MKRLLIALGLALIMIAVLATAAFAASPPASLGQYSKAENTAGDPGIIADEVAEIKDANPDKPFGQVQKSLMRSNNLIPGLAN